MNGRSRNCSYVEGVFRSHDQAGVVRAVVLFWSSRWPLALPDRVEMRVVSDSSRRSSEPDAPDRPLNCPAKRRSTISPIAAFPADPYHHPGA